MLLGLGNRGVLHRVSCHYLPLYRLIKGVPQEFVYLPYCAGGDKLTIGMPIPGNRFHGLEVFVELGHHPGADVVQLYIPDNGLDVVVD